MPRRTVAITLAAILLLASAGAAQFRGRGGRQGFNGRALRYATLEDFDGGYQFCRLVFRNGSDGDGAGWNVDFPRADENLSIRLSELSRTPVSMDENREPKSLLLNLRQPEVFHCPILMMTEPGGAYFDEEEVDESPEVSVEGRLSLGRRLLGRVCVGLLGKPDSPRAAVRAISDLSTCRPITSSFTRCSR